MNNQQFRKRLLSVLLVLTMLCSMLPAAFAADGLEVSDATAETDPVSENNAGSDDLSSELPDGDDAGPDAAPTADDSQNPPDGEAEGANTLTDLPADDSASTADGNDDADSGSEADGAAEGDLTEDGADDGDPAQGQEEELLEEGDEGNLDEDEEGTADGDDPAERLVLVRFVSAQELTLLLADGEGLNVEPATDAVIAEYEAALQAEVTDTEADAQDPIAEAEVITPEPVPAAADAADVQAEADGIVFSASYLLAPGSYTYTAEAEGFRSLSEALTVSGETPWGTVIELALKEGIPFGFTGMPEDYEFSDEELAKKQALTEHDVVGMLEEMTPGVDYVEGEVFFLADTREYAELVAGAYSAELESYEYGVAILRLSEATTLEAVTAAADMDLPLPAVEANQIVYAEPDYGEARLYVNNDINAMSGEEVNTRESWQTWYENSPNPDLYLRDPTADDYQWMHDMVNTYEAWGVTKGGDVKVAVIDSGVAAHEDLSFSTITISGLTGYVDDHGTHVAGIIGAIRDNGTGGAGIAPGADIISIRACDDDGSYTSARLAEAIEAALSGGAQVINMSIGGYGYSTDLYNKLLKAVNRGVTVVVSMGNEATNVKSYPAAYSIPGLIAVGSVNEAGKRSAFSNYGAWQDVAAPGSAIMSTVPGGYVIHSGTSMAAPVVSGVCALYLAAHPDASPAQVEKAVRAATSGGIVDASKFFVSEKAAPTITIPGLSGGEVPYGSWIELSGALPEDDLVYTLNGKTPAVKNGVVTVGTKYTGFLQVTAENGFTVGKKVTLKAVRVNGLGTVSKVATKSFKVGYANPSGVEVPTVPEYVVSGKSVTLKATVLPAEALQTVTWSVISAPAGVSVNAKTGVLKTAAASYGTATVRAASAANPACYTEISIPVIPVKPVKKVVLNSSSYTFNLPSDEYSSFDLALSAFDADGQPVVYVSYTFASSNRKVADVSANGTVTPVGKGKCTITVKAGDGSNASAKFTVQVRQNVTSLSISGIGSVAPGKTVSYKVSALPSSADSKAVSWGVSENPYGITVNSSGKLSVPAGVPTGYIFTLTATAKDYGGTGTFKIIEVQRPATYIDGIRVEDDSFGGNGWQANKNGTLKQADLYSVETDYWWGDEKTWHDSYVQLSASTDAQRYIWSSSNENIATVDQSGLVQAVSAGTATITFRADDASGKKATAKIRVINPASGIAIVSSAGSLSNSVAYDPELLLTDEYKTLAVGKSAKNTARLADAFGKPTITKVKWTCDVRVYDSNEEVVYLEELFKSKKWVSVSSSGVVSVKKNVSAYLDDYGVFVDVYAETTDGTELGAWITYGVVRPLTKVTLSWDPDYAGRTSLSCTVARNVPDPEGRDLYYYYTCYIQGWPSKYNWYWDGDYSVKSSKPDVAGAVIEDDGRNSCLKIIPGQKKGTAKITVTANDGSGKKATITVKVS